MADRNECQVIADILDQTRKLGAYYLKKLEGDFFFRKPVLENHSFNSPAWIACHVAWAENYIVANKLGDFSIAPEWLKRFAIGKTAPPENEYPSAEEILNTSKTIHKRCIQLIRELPVESLDRPERLDFINWDTDLRNVLFHCIRHEGVHNGHLTWLIKMNGIKGE